MMSFLEVDMFNMLMISKTELIAVSGSICALCLFLFVMAEHCLFLCVSESINDLFCFICVYDLFRHLAFFALSLWPSILKVSSKGCSILPLSPFWLFAARQIESTVRVS